jgi:hypothetical protein
VRTSDGYLTAINGDTGFERWNVQGAWSASQWSWRARRGKSVLVAGENALYGFRGRDGQQLTVPPAGRPPSRTAASTWRAILVCARSASPTETRTPGAMAEQCDHLRAEIKALESQLAADQEELKTAPPGRREALIFQIRMAKAEIRQLQTDLTRCEAATDPPLTNPRVFGSEISQGIANRELVAGKDTLARVFVGVPKPVNLPLTAEDFGEERISIPDDFHFEVPPFGESRLDYASLELKTPTGSRFQVPATMSGRFTNITRSVAEEDNVNFYIGGDLLSRTGTYEFFARFYRDGGLVGTLSLGQRQFLDTKDLRLLIKVNTFPMPDAAWDTVLRALQFVQRNFPVRTGIAPMDSDLSAGLRFFIDPVPYDSGWPTWDKAKAALTAFNQRQAELGRPDRADKLVNVRTQQPGESPLGGVGERPGVISGSILNVNPPGDSYYATIMSQELGHNFGLGHVQNPLIPSTETAFDLLNRNSLGGAQAIMFNPVGANEICMFSPAEWSTIRNGLLQLSSSGPV